MSRPNETSNGISTVKHYAYKFVGGTGEHSGKHGGVILPDSLRWLWRSATPKADTK